MWEKDGSPRNLLLPKKQFPVQHRAWCLGQSSLGSVWAFSWISVGFGRSHRLKTKQEQSWVQLWGCLNWVVTLPWRLAAQRPFKGRLFKLLQQQPRPEHRKAALRTLQEYFDSWHSSWSEGDSSVCASKPQLSHFSPHIYLLLQVSSSWAAQRGTWCRCVCCAEKETVLQPSSTGQGISLRLILSVSWLLSPHPSASGEAGNHLLYFHSHASLA